MTVRSPNRYDCMLHTAIMAASTASNSAKGDSMSPLDDDDNEDEDDEVVKAHILLMIPF